MEVNFKTNNYNVQNNKDNVSMHEQKTATDNTVRYTSNTISPEASEALKAQKLAGVNVSFKGQPKQFSEKDVNIQVTCCGCSDIKGNTRDLNDFRAAMQANFGYNWHNNFLKPKLLRNANGDEKRNGDSTTAIVIPLKLGTPGLRGGDLVAIVLNGNIPTEIAEELITYMSEIGILDKTPVGQRQYYINSQDPYNFMSNPKIKTAIANFINKKLTEGTNKTQETITTDNNTNKYKITSKSINVAGTDCLQNDNNSRNVKDYIRTFLKNDRKFTVVYEQINESGHNLDSTVILIPSKKDSWDFLTIQIDAKIPQEECKNLVNYLVRQKMTNVNHPDFRKTVVEYFNKQ